MTLDHAAFAEWDAAYVLGALTAADRRAYEEHLAECELCRAAVAELAPLPGLLARAPRPAVDDEAGAPPDEPRPPDEPAASDEPAEVVGPRADLVDLVLRRERRHRLRRRLVSAGIAAVAVIGLAVAVPLATRGPEPAETVTLSQQVETPLTASVSLTPASWGTRLSMVCEYPAPSATPGGPYGPPGGAGGVYSLVVTDIDGTASQVSTWSARPGVDVLLDAATAVPLDRIASVEIRSASGTAVLAADRTTG